MYIKTDFYFLIIITWIILKYVFVFSLVFDFWSAFYSEYFVSILLSIHTSLIRSLARQISLFYRESIPGCNSTIVLHPLAPVHCSRNIVLQVNFLEQDSWGIDILASLLWCTKNWRFEEWFNNTLKNNPIRFKKLSPIVSSRKNEARPSVRRKQVSTSAEM